MQLSVIHTTYNREEHLKAILPRFELNAYRHPEIDFELIILDGGSSDRTKDVTLEFMNRETVKTKYVHVGFGKWTNPSLPRNIALRHVEGRIGCTMDADHWVGQDFVSGAYRAFQDKSDNVISLAMVKDSNKAKIPWIKVNEALLNPLMEKNCNILEFYEFVGIPVASTHSAWIVSYPMNVARKIGGYCESFSGGNWGRDEDIFLLMMQRFLRITKEYYKEFAAIHLCHEVKRFNIERNSNHNHNIFAEKRDNLMRTIAENSATNWGQVPEGVEYYVERNF